MKIARKIFSHANSMQNPRSCVDFEVEKSEIARAAVAQKQVHTREELLHTKKEHLHTKERLLSYAYSFTASP